MATKTKLFLRETRQGRIAIFLLTALVIGWWALRLPEASQAAPILTITPLTWNVVGLDPTNLAGSPNQYLVGAQVCNDDVTATSSVQAVFQWTSSNEHISLVTGQAFTQTLATLPAAACQDFYYTVQVNRSAAAVGTERSFTITATSTGGDAVSTPANRAVRVEAFSPETLTEAQTLTGPDEVTVGQQYEYVAQKNGLAGKQQLVQQLLFSSPNFRVVDIDATYTIPPGSSNERFYADACGWISTVGDPNYLTCSGTPGYTGGEVGGSIVTTYTVEVLAEGVFTVTHLIYDYAGGAYHYQNGFGTDSLVITATQPQPDPTGTAAALTAVFQTQAAGTATATALTATAHYTLTATAQAGTPVTSTPTPSITPTPTATGTITPSPVMTYTVNPVEARVGQNMTFNLRLTNNGRAPAQLASVTDSFSTYLDILSVNTSKGTFTTTPALRSFSVNLGTLMPSETAVITVVVTVNTTTRTNQNLTNTARFTYAYGGLNYTLNSSVSYRLIGSTTLPNTGGLQLGPDDDRWSSALGSSHEGYGSNHSQRVTEAQDERQTDPLVIVARMFALMLGALGGAGLLYGWRSRRHKPEWGAWYMKVGALFAVTSLFFGAAALALNRAPPDSDPGILVQVTETAPAQANLPNLPGSNSEGGTYHLVLPTGEPETLPNFPIPTPSMVAENPQEEAPDTSAIERIMIPALGVDTIVKYVPFDGLTWLIAGLQQEVAWLGETSWPGLGSNTALAGHVTLRNGAHGPFHELQSLKDGDEIFLYTADKVYTYHVAEARTVEETDFTVIAPSENTRLTLITCTGWDEQMRFYLQRFIVGADLVQSRPRATAGGIP